MAPRASKRLLNSDDSKSDSDKRLKYASEEGQESLTENDHRNIAAAIFEVGLKNASPSIIMEMMTTSDNGITSERVKSHLQKYRKNRAKSTAEFFNDYESFMQKAMTVGAAGTKLVSPDAIKKMIGSEGLFGGDLAAFLSYSALHDETIEMRNDVFDKDTTEAAEKGSYEMKEHAKGASIPFPKLTEEERRSPLGISISNAISLFYSMTQHLTEEREAKQKALAAAKEATDQKPLQADVPTRQVDYRTELSPSTGHGFNPLLYAQQPKFSAQPLTEYPRIKSGLSPLLTTAPFDDKSIMNQVS